MIQCIDTTVEWQKFFVHPFWKAEVLQGLSRASIAWYVTMCGKFTYQNGFSIFICNWTIAALSLWCVWCKTRVFLCCIFGRLARSVGVLYQTATRQKATGDFITRVSLFACFLLWYSTILHFTVNQRCSYWWWSDDFFTKKEARFTSKPGSLDRLSWRSQCQRAQKNNAYVNGIIQSYSYQQERTMVTSGKKIGEAKAGGETPPHTASQAMG